MQAIRADRALLLKAQAAQAHEGGDREAVLKAYRDTRAYLKSVDPAKVSPARASALKSLIGQWKAHGMKQRVPSKLKAVLMSDEELLTTTSLFRLIPLALDKTNKALEWVGTGKEEKLNNAFAFSQAVMAKAGEEPLIIGTPNRKRIGKLVHLWHRKAGRTLPVPGSVRYINVQNRTVYGGGESQTRTLSTEEVEEVKSRIKGGLRTVGYVFSALLGAGSGALFAPAIDMSRSKGAALGAGASLALAIVKNKLRDREEANEETASD